jgi:tetratricopeptide (TPR) repeat protein
MNYKKVGLLFFGLLIFGFSFAQYNKEKVSVKARKEFNEAQLALQMGDFKSAAIRLQRAIEADNTFCDALILLGDVQHHEHENKSAIVNYKKALAIDENYAFKKIKAIGEIFLEENKTDSAEFYFDKYLQSSKITASEKASTEHIVANLHFIQNAKAHPVQFNPIRMSDAINSEYDEYYPTLSTDGNTLIFTRKIGQDEDFYISKKVNGVWQKAMPLPSPLN